MSTPSNIPLLGLVLAGGGSTRMGHDKSGIAYHGVPQEEWMRRLLEPFCTSVYVAVGRKKEIRHISCRLEDDPCWGAIGPAAGLLTAASLHPGAAWLVTGCDYPYITSEGIRVLVRNRQQNHAAVAFINPLTQAPEPLLTIYEPAAIQKLLERLKSGDSSLRRLLEDVETVRLAPDHQEWIFSIDTPSERDKALARFNSSRSTGQDSS